MPRIKQLDGLRALAFLSVFIHHAYHVPALWIGVDAFFVLSGFLITGILLRAKETEGNFFGTFYFRRARRILPAYSLAIALAAMLFTFDWPHIWYWYAFFAANIGESLGKAGGGALQPLWSLAVEEQFYLIWPLLVYFTPRRNLTKIVVGLLIGAPIIRAVLTFTSASHFPVYFLAPARMDLLAAGALLAIHRDTVAEYGRSYWLTLSVAAGGIFCLLSLFFRSFRTSANSLLFNTAGYSLSVVFFTAILAYIVLLDGGPVFSVLTSPLLMGLGTISYMMYLVHETIIRVMPEYPAIALLCTIGFSALSWKLVEKPILDMRKSSDQKRALSSPSVQSIARIPQ